MIKNNQQTLLADKIEFYRSIEASVIDLIHSMYNFTPLWKFPNFNSQDWEKTREIQKNPWEWEKLVFTGKNGKNGKNCLFLKYMFKKHVKKHWQINDEMF